MSLAAGRISLTSLVMAASLGLALGTEHTALVRCPPGSVNVPAGADLHAYVEDGAAQTYCLAAGTYELGATSLKPDSGDRLLGPPVTVGPLGEITAKAFVHKTSTSTTDKGVIEAIYSNSTLSVANLDISGACCSDYEGSMGINYGFGKLINLTVSYSRVHDNSNMGVSGGYGLRVDHSEIDHNGGEGLSNNNYNAGIKSIHYAVITHSYFHDNDPNGMWWDCDAPGGVFTNNRVDRHQRSGVLIEISSGDASSEETLPQGASYGFVITENTLSFNNLDDAPGHAGLTILDSMNVEASANTITDSLDHDVYVYKDSRAGRSHDGCSSGFAPSGIEIHDNTHGPQDINGCDVSGITCSHNTKIKPEGGWWSPLG